MVVAIKLISFDQIILLLERQQKIIMPITVYECHHLISAHALSSNTDIWYNIICMTRSYKYIALI